MEYENEAATTGVVCKGSFDFTEEVVFNLGKGVEGTFKLFE